MPRVLRHALTWSRDDGLYTLQAQGQAARRFRPGDDAAWLGWLGGVTAFAFHGAAGSLNAHLEARPRGGRYWYAYHTAGGRTRKRYLGRTTTVSFARLEAVAAALATEPGSAPTVREAEATHGADGGARDALSAVARATDAADALPATKLAPPQLSATLVGREYLLGALDAAFSTRLTLLAAPAGWGKTTILAAWARRHPGRIAWLALEAADDDPARFWGAVIAALRTRAPGVGADALALLRAPQPPPQPVVATALLNELAGGHEGDAPLILVLDDYHLIADPAIQESVRFFLDHLPARLRLIVASRVDPALPLARLRARGQLLEFRAAELRFTRAEVADFLRRALDGPLADEEVAALAARTEGWAAGLQLAAVGLRQGGDRAAWLARFTGGHRYLLDYVEDEILARQPPTVRRFLLRAAVLTRLDAASCAAVAGEPASREILESLERANLFIVPLDGERRWYRLHDLFREALLARAHASEPGLVPEAHRRAARWHAAHGDAREAIAHALAAEDYALAADLIAREAPRLWLGGEAGAVLTWLLALPDAALRRHARLALDAALRLLESLHATTGAPFAAARVRVERTLSRVEEALRAPTDSDIPAAEAALLRRRRHLLRAWIETRALLQRGDAAGLTALAGETAGPTEEEEVRWQMIGHALTFWLIHSLRREGPRLLPRLLDVKRRALDAGEHQAALTATVWLAHVYGDAGRPGDVERECLKGLALAGRLGMRTASTGYLHFALADAYYAQDRLDEASGALRDMFAIAQTWQQLDLLIWGNLALARLALVGGDPAAADRALRGAEEAVRRGQFAIFAPAVAAARARYWLATGALARASDWAARTAPDPHTLTPAEHDAALARVRVALARREYPQALAALERFGTQLDRPDDVPTAIEYLALSVVALHHAGERARVRQVAARLFALTEPAGGLRVYLDAGAPMERALAALLKMLSGEPPDAPALPRAYVSRLLAAFEDGRQVARPPAATATSPALVEPLTRREREVLRHLAGGASNQEIAAALAISLDTAKKHVGNLLAKLGAGSRTQAVARARELALL